MFETKILKKKSLKKYRKRSLENKISKKIGRKQNIAQIGRKQNIEKHRSKNIEKKIGRKQNIEKKSLKISHKWVENKISKKNRSKKYRTHRSKTKYRKKSLAHKTFARKKTFEKLTKASIENNFFHFKGPKMGDLNFFRDSTEWHVTDQSNKRTEIPRCEIRSARDLSRDEFRHEYLERNRPVRV